MTVTTAPVFLLGDVSFHLKKLSIRADKEVGGGIRLTLSASGEPREVDGHLWRPQLEFGPLILQGDGLSAIERRSFVEPRNRGEQYVIVFDHHALTEPVIEFGHVVDGAIDISLRGRSLVPTADGLRDATIEVRGRAEIDGNLRPWVPTEQPPAGRKVCRACGAVSFDEVPRCPSCGVGAWWND